MPMPRHIYAKRRRRPARMDSNTLLILVLVLLLVGTLPSWPHSRSWGYGPSGILGTILFVLLVLTLFRVV